MDYENTGIVAPGTSMRRATVILLVVLLVVATGLGSYFYARRDAAASQDEAARRGAQLAQVQDQLRSAAKQNDYLAEQVRQAHRDLTNAGTDSASQEKKLRIALRAARDAQAKAKAKLKGLSSGLSGSMGSVTYVPPAKKGGAGAIDGSITIKNSAGSPLDAVCIVQVGSVAYAVTRHAVPAGGSVLESFHYAYAGPKPSGVSSGGCGRL
jgi:uncharacterized membrane protein